MSFSSQFEMMFRSGTPGEAVGDLNGPKIPARTGRAACPNLVIEPEYEDLTVGMKTAASGCLFILDRIGGHDAGMLCHVAASDQATVDEISFVIHVGVNVVGELAIALVALQSHVVRCRSHPYRLPAHSQRRFPNAQVMARRNHGEWLGVREAIVLRSAVQIQLAHGH